MSGRVYSTNAQSRVVDLMHEHGDGSVTLETRQDVTEIVEDNKGIRNTFGKRAGWKGSWHRVAALPLTVLIDLQRRGIMDETKRFLAWLNDRDNEAFRTRPGKV